MSRASRRLALASYVRLNHAANTARACASRHLGDSGLTLTQFAVLEALYHLGPMSLTEIAGKVLTTGGNLTMVAGNLERDGLVRRQRSPEDGRVQIVGLTAKGKVLVRRIFPVHAAAIAEFMTVLDAGELEQLGELCRKLGRQVRAGG
ncbi:MAG TPA: MarR family transcriptional regulator [Candidatus Angelobacter sp.]|nr:MarR family transcriptional regulator [Candidatus Angelobacter sp.]